MQKVIGVRFKKAGRIHYFNPGQFDITRGDTVIIETQRGLEYAQVVISPRELADEKLKVDNIRRKATQADLDQINENRSRAQEAFSICQDKIKEHKLSMNLIGVEYTFDANKIIFSFTADGRVDFRDLVKDLASVFRTRIELRQVGVRDEAKLLGGVGCCGRPLCCATFLGDFIPVSIRMAKDQNLSLNPAKISGICGRLMCCLKYESDYYCEQCPHEVVPIKEPRLDMRVVVDEGAGRVISINRQRRTATIILDDSQTVIAPWDNIFEAESTDGDVKTVVAAVAEGEGVASETEKSFDARRGASDEARRTAEEPRRGANENRSDRFSRRSRRPPSSTSSNFSSQPRSNSSPQNRSNFSSQNKPNVQPRDNKDSRDTRDNRETREARDHRDKGNKKFQKHGRRNEDYRQSKKHNPRRHDTYED